MQVFGVVGSPAERDRVVDRLVSELGERVGVVRSGIDSSPPRESGAAITYGLEGDRWVATGGGRDLESVLDDLAPECRYAVVVGVPGAEIPHVVLGGREVDGDVLARAPTADALEVVEVREAIDAVEHRETLQSLVRRAKRSPEEVYAGAIATFTGRVRAKDGPEDDYTEYLEFERYDDVVVERMAEIESTLEARDGVYEVLLHHRTGVMEAGEDIVFVVVLAGHRAAAFETVEDGIDRLKAVVPLFKKEVTVEETFWAHER